MEILQQMLSPKQLGELVRTRREELRRSQKAVARQLQVSQTTLHKIETGSITTSRHLPRLFMLLGIPLDKLDPIYAGGAAQLLPSIEPEEATLVQISSRRRVLIVAKVEYEIADRYLRDDGTEGRGILVTWTMRNGATVSGLLDLALLPTAIRHFYRLAQELGVDLTTLQPGI